MKTKKSVHLMLALAAASAATATGGELSPIPLEHQQVGNQLILRWTNAAFSLQSAPRVQDVFTNVPGATSPFTNALADIQRYFRLRGEAAPAGMVLIPAGSFTMGDPFSEGVTNELPLHPVFVSAFYLDRTEVTKALWDTVYAWATTNGYAFDHAGSGKAAAHPVHTVNWFDAVRWCNARSEMEGLTPVYYLDTEFTHVYREATQAALWTNFVKWDANGYRLPTEAEWEKAARAGLIGQRFPWGDTITHTQANYYSSATYTYDISATRGYHPNYSSGGFPYTNPVEDFAPNNYGLYGLADNVSEWCWDWFDAGWYARPAATNDNCRGPRGDGMTYRVRRGGSWNVYANKARAAYRDYGGPGDATSSFGFRCVRGL